MHTVVMQGLAGGNKKNDTNIGHILRDCILTERAFAGCLPCPMGDAVCSLALLWIEVRRRIRFHDPPRWVVDVSWRS